jgi:hypothetical protein
MHRTHGRLKILARKSRHARTALRKATTIAIVEKLEQRQLLAGTDPIINEFMASNKTGITDGFGDNSDWIEIYNPTAAPVNMLGWHLSNDITLPNEWTFPSISINPNSYMIVWASGRNLTDPASPLHTDFKLDPNPGEYLALTRPNSSVVTEFAPTYPRQLDDTSYGLNSAGTSYQYMTTETPNAPNIDGANGVVDDTKFSIDRGLFSAPFDVAITTATAGATIRYTTNGSPPTATTGTVYSSPVHISTTTTLRAAAFKTGLISSDTDTQTYLFLADVVNLRNSLVSATITRTTTTATVTTATPHGFASGASIMVSGSDQSQYNGTFTITVTGANTFTYPVAGSPATPATGAISVGPPTITTGPLAGYPNSWGTYNSPGSGPVAADYEMDPEVVTDPVYINRIIGALGAIPSMSIVMPISDLFGASNGIYSFPTTQDADVPLKTVGSITRSGSVATVTLSGHGYVNGDRIWISNANQADYNGTFTIFNVTSTTFQYNIVATAPASATGSPIYAQKKNNAQQWERAASIELINPDGSKGFQINAGVQVQGGASREPVKSGKHSFRLLFKTTYGDSSLDYPLFDDSNVTSFDSLILKAGFNNSWVHGDTNQRNHNLGIVQDQFASDAQLAMGDVSKHGRYVQLYLNGVYWGLYDLMERPEASFAASYFGGPKEDYDVVDNTDSLIDGNLLAFNNLVNLMNADLTVQANYDAIKPYLDIPSFADYLILMYYGGNNDWTDHNWYASRRSRVDGVPSNVDGFHFYSFDSERTLEGTTDNITGNDVAGQPSHFFQRLRTNPEFRQLFADRLHALLFNNGVLSPDVNAARLRTELDKVDPAIVGESARWGDYRRDLSTYCAGYVCTPRALYTRDNQWVTEENRILSTYFPIRGSNVLNVFRNMTPSPLYPNMDAPEFAQLGGNVNLGYSLNVTSNSGGIVYYTLDGSDPRLVGGAVAPTAQTYSGSITINNSEEIQARAFNPQTSVWSALSDFKFFVVPPPALRITEMLYNPKKPAGSLLDDDEYQFIELQNTSGSSINLGGISIEGVNHFVFPNMSLAAGARTLVVANQAAFESRYGTGLPIAGVFTGRLSHGGEKISLLTSLGQIIEQFTYSDGWYGPTDGDGFSLVAVDSLATDAILSTQDGWRPSMQLNGAPGAADPGINHNAIVINEVLSNTGGDPWIEFRNQSGNSIDIGGWFLTNDALNLTKYTIPGGTSVPANGYLRIFQSTTFGSAFTLSASGGELKLSSNIGATLGSYRDGVDFGAADPNVSFGRYIKSTGGSDFTAMSSQTPGAANSAPLVGPVVINEVMYNPFNTGDEFIEIKNISGSTVALNDGTNGWQFTAGVGFTFGAGTSLAAGEVALIVPIDPTAFRTKYSIPAGVQIFGPYTGTLSNNGENVELSKPTVGIAPVPYVEVDRVNYKDDGSWPIFANGIGPSLQRNSGSAYGNDAANWSASASGGTPGAANVLKNAPIIAPISDATINEGSAFVASGSFADVDAGDTWTGTVYWGDSGIPQTLTLNANKTFSLNHTYVDSGVFTVLVTITDGGKLFGTDSIVVKVSNVAPNATVTSSGTVNEGSSGSITISARTDPSTTDVSAGYFLDYDFNNDGIFETTNAVNVASSFVVTVPSTYLNDGPGTKIVRVRLIDKDGGFRDFLPSFTVNNLPPTATFGNSGPVNESTTGATVNFTAQSDVPADLATLTYSYDLDNDSIFEITGSSSPSATIPASILAESGTKTLRGRVTDKDGGSNTYTTVITINNVAPTAALGNSGPVSEGASSATVSFSNQVDSPGDTAAGFTYSYDFDNDNNFEITGSSSASANVPASFLVDGPASHVIHARITDRDGGFNDYTTTLNVNNVNPSISSIADKVVGMSTPMSASGSVSDPGTADTTFTATVDYGAGGGQQPLTINPDKTFSLGNTYATPGLYTVTVRVTDKDGGAATPRTFNVNVRGSSLTGTAGADNYYIRLDGAHANVEFYENAAPPGQPPTFVIPVSALTNISVDGQGGDDMLTVDYINTNPIPSGGLTYTAGSATNGDTLKIIGDGSLSASDALGATAGGGTITIAGRSINHSGVENLIASQLSSLTLVTPLAADNLTATLSSGQTVITGNSGGTALPAVQLSAIGTLILDAASNEGAGDDTFIINSAGNFSGGSTTLGIAAGSGNNTLTVNGGAPNLDTNFGAAAGQNLAVTVANSAVVNLPSSQNLKSLTQSGTSRVNLAGTDKLLKTSGLTLGANSILDLDGNDMIVQATAPTRSAVMSAITGWIKTARNTSPTRWMGNGITSSVAAANAARNTGVAARINEVSGGGVLLTSFDGQSVDVNSILLKYTYEGDANLNGRIEPDDFAAIDAGFINRATGYGNGDFDFSGSIDSDDYFAIDRAFGSQGATLSGGSLEPAPQAPAAAEIISAPTTTDTQEPATQATPVIMPERTAVKKSKHHRRKDRDEGRVWDVRSKSGSHAFPLRLI